MLDSIAALERAGFEGFVSIGALRAERLQRIPAAPGVYVILWPHADAPSFLAQSPAGRYTGRDPTLPVAELASAWVASSAVVYLGKAGGPGTRATLRSRLAAYLRHGRGHRASHWGGRAIWQLPDAEALVVAWRPLAQEDPRTVERESLQAFAAHHGRRPFANRTG